MRVLTIAALCILSSSVHGQSDWMSTNANSLLYVDVNKPFYKEDKYINFGSSVITLIPQFGYSTGKAIRFEIPISIISLKKPFKDDSEIGLGNLYVGHRSVSEDKANQWDIGVRLPTASDEKFSAFINSAWSDFERLYAYTPDVAAAVVMFQHHKATGNNLVYGIRAGSAATYITEDGVDEPLDLWAHYGAYGGFETDKFIGTVGFRGMIILTEENDFSERHISHLEGAARLKSALVRPGILFKIPMDEDVSDLVEYTISLNLEFPIR